ncbi:hypothetical protein [Rhizobium sp. P38BS-XIX]|uniref:hypothetical protein n=1 Tax=Rhizobium sp. P38BS-XIX TaxID=2726740 RepID=UPI001FEEE744|nr:hypothetical protein [Rhizobium sp. P38BS-XIX]
MPQQQALDDITSTMLALVAKEFAELIFGYFNRRKAVDGLRFVGEVIDKPADGEGEDAFARRELEYLSNGFKGDVRIAFLIQEENRAPHAAARALFDPATDIREHDLELCVMKEYRFSDRSKVAFLRQLLPKKVDVVLFAVDEMIFGVDGERLCPPDICFHLSLVYSIQEEKWCAADKLAGITKSTTSAKSVDQRDALSLLGVAHERCWEIILKIGLDETQFRAAVSAKRRQLTA